MALNEEHASGRHGDYFCVAVVVIVNAVPVQCPQFAKYVVCVSRFRNGKI